MSELEALSNTPNIVETRMMETGETVAIDGECIAIGSPSSHSHGTASPHPRPPRPFPELVYSCWLWYREAPPSTTLSER